MNVAIGSDHGGYDLKEAIKGWLTERGMTVEDVGSPNKDSVDYPDFGNSVAAKVSQHSVDDAILVCTTGIGMSILANKHHGVRAALCLTADMARTARTHNEANLLVLAGGLTSEEEANAIIDEWFSQEF